VFISLEGVDGSGKSTQARLLVEALGPETVAIREPGGTEAAERIRELLADPTLPLDPLAELLLFLAARAQLIQDTIAPALAAGQIVVSDRYSDSTLAYQAYAGGLPVEEVEAAINSATGGLWPDLTLLLDVPPEVGLARQATRNRMENKGLEFHTRVREGFLAQWQRYPERIHRIDAARPLEQVRAELFHHVEAFLG
jgi:dTMP kinase